MKFNVDVNRKVLKKMVLKITIAEHYSFIILLRIKWWFAVIVEMHIFSLYFTHFEVKDETLHKYM